MPREVRCPVCHAPVPVPEKAGTQVVRCPDCDERFDPSKPPAPKPTVGRAREDKPIPLAGDEPS
jgi:hypothetical protein